MYVKLSEVLKKYPGLHKNKNQNKPRPNHADPHIIALALEFKDMGYNPIIINEEGNKTNKIPWYTIFCLSNHTRSKEVFDQARSIIGNLTTRYRSTTTKITTNLNFYFSDDPNTPQTNIDINLISLVNKAIDSIPQIFQKLNKTKMTIDNDYIHYINIFYRVS